MYGNYFRGYSYTTIYADLPLGIEIKDDGTLWSVDVQEFHSGFYGKKKK